MRLLHIQYTYTFRSTKSVWKKQIEHNKSNSTYIICWPSWAEIACLSAVDSQRRTVGRISAVRRPITTCATSILTWFCLNTHATRLWAVLFHELWQGRAVTLWCPLITEPVLVIAPLWHCSDPMCCSFCGGCSRNCCDHCKKRHHSSIKVKSIFVLLYLTHFWSIIRKKADAWIAANLIQPASLSTNQGDIYMVWPGLIYIVSKHTNYYTLFNGVVSFCVLYSELPALIL